MLGQYVLINSTVEQDSKINISGLPEEKYLAKIESKGKVSTYHLKISK